MWSSILIFFDAPASSMPSRIRDYPKRFALSLRTELETAKFSRREKSRVGIDLALFAVRQCCFANRKEKLCLPKKIASEKFKKQSDEEL